MPWIILIFAGIFEVIGVSSINRLNRQFNLSSLFIFILFFGLSFSFLSIAMASIPMGTAYAVWTGIGTVGATLLGMFLFNEEKSFKRLLFLGMILISVIGLKVLE
ncbi:DMT family transporter [Exiguobacterium sp. S22-S28]|uniref:DMT family transporter n=1 Tax=Exiguobacterium sp. S22-S28 TaxID=3342768 RepID=UPI00372D2EE4